MIYVFLLLLNNKQTKKKKRFEILSGPCMTIFFFFSDQALDPGTGIPVKSIWA